MTQPANTAASPILRLREFSEILVRRGIVAAEAMEDPEDYDDHETENAVLGAWAEIDLIIRLNTKPNRQ
jgi:hypothetical protein